MPETLELPKLRKKHSRCSHEAITSEFKGVSWDSRRGMWHAYWTYATAPNVKQHEELGYFSVEKDAALAWDAHIRELYGPAGIYNFPHAGEQSVFCEHEEEV